MKLWGRQQGGRGTGNFLKARLARVGSHRPAWLPTLIPHIVAGVLASQQPGRVEEVAVRDRISFFSTYKAFFELPPPTPKKGSGQRGGEWG